MFLIREYRPDDKKESVEIYKRAMEYTGLYDEECRIESNYNCIADECTGAGGIFLVGEYKGDIIAVGGIKKSRNGLAEIKGMAVRPDMQGRGFGKQLLAEIEKRTLKAGYRGIKLETTETQVTAQRLFVSSGYMQKGTMQILDENLMLFEKLYNFNT
jgi:GNAT superfamily N-acetyltransferase